MQNELTKSEPLIKVEETLVEMKERACKSADEIIDAVKNGEINPIDVKIKADFLMKELKRIVDSTSYETECECEKNDNKFSYQGVQVSLQLRKKYDYSAVNEWNEISDKIDELNAQRKAIEEKYKGASLTNKIVDTTTGEVITSIPYLTSKVITLKASK